MTDNDEMIESLLEKFENENKDQLKLNRKLYEEKLARRKIINEKKQKEQRKKYAKKYAKKAKFKKYNLTLEKYNKMLKEQNDCCAMCKTHKSMFKRSLHIDHDHYTNKIRGLLCVRCNSLLGNAQDRIDILEEAIKYLKKNEIAS